MVRPFKHAQLPNLASPAASYQIYTYVLVSLTVYTSEMGALGPLTTRSVVADADMVG